MDENQRVTTRVLQTSPPLLLVPTNTFRIYCVILSSSPMQVYINDICDLKEAKLYMCVTPTSFKD